MLTKKTWTLLNLNFFILFFEKQNNKLAHTNVPKPPRVFFFGVY
jgi:hypothetical protein